MPEVEGRVQEGKAATEARAWSADEIEDVLKKLQKTGDIHADGIAIDTELFTRILKAAPKAEDGRPVFKSVSFYGATFPDPFKGGFRGATFRDVANFNEASFGAMFDFSETTFRNGVLFIAANFQDGASFNGASFGEPASFTQATFGRWAHFISANFGKQAEFTRANFGEEASFLGASFGEGALLVDVIFDHGPVFRGVVFSKNASFGPLVVRGSLNLAYATFEDHERFEVAAVWIWGHGARFRGGGNLRVRWAQIDLTEAVFAERTTLGGLDLPVDNLADLDPPPFSPYIGLGGKSDPRPKLVSLQGAEAGYLTLSDVDVAACRFAGVHNLEGLRLEGASSFVPAPPRRGRGGRQALAEEHQLREQRHPGHSWYPEICKPVAPPVGIDLELVDAAKLANLYRSLRKGREDAKDAPGAGDFYYGEMEMRRMLPASRTDWWVLSAYWLLSGYGLRASRALIWFGIVVLVFSLALWVGGLKSFPGWSVDGWLMAAKTSFLSATSLLRPPPTNLSPIGEILDAILRLLGTSLLGLALFSLRGRIKR